MVASSRGIAVREIVPLGIVRKAMVRSMRTSVATVALSQVSRELDVSALGALRRELAVASGTRIPLNALLMAAVARTLPRHPLLNAELQEDAILLYEPVNLGMAVAVPDGLIVAVIPNANTLPPEELAAAIEDRASRARSGTLKLADIEGGTFTVSNLGMYGIDGGVPLPRPPESAILLVGAIKPRPAAHEGQVVIRDAAWFSLSFDHRFIDGALAARFLEDLQATLAQPQSLFE